MSKWHLLQPWIKYLGQGKEYKQNWAGTENFDNCICVMIAHHYYEIFICGRNLILGSISTQLWPSINIFYFSKTLCPKLLGNIRLHVYCAFYGIYQVPLYLEWMKTFLKCCRVAKYYVHDCLRVFFYPWHCE